MGAAPSPGKPLRVALFGLGTVGRPVAAHLLDAAWRLVVEGHGITPPELVAIGVREPERPRGIALPEHVRVTDALEELAVDPDVDVIVELLGGIETPSGILARALEAGKPVVTANKALVAALGPSLEAATRAAGMALRFEAAVAGGVPVLAPIVLDLAANRIDAVRGIVNGTTNHILSAMAAEGRQYDEVLAEAKARGYTEADPSGDVEGRDAADKLAILARLAFGQWPDVAHLRRAAPATAGDAGSGITGVRTRELQRAAALGLTLKLIARAERSTDGAVHAAVTVAAVPAGSPLGRTDGVANLVEVIGVPVGRVAFRGPGAGGEATSSAVLGDLLALARGEGSTWDPLPAATSTTETADDFGGTRAWFFVADDLVGSPMPARLRDLVLASDEEAVVTRPMHLDELRVRLLELDIKVTLYPVLEMAAA